jgi:hypothetical protein
MLAAWSMAICMRMDAWAIPVHPTAYHHRLLAPNSPADTCSSCFGCAADPVSIPAMLRCHHAPCHLHGHLHDQGFPRIETSDLCLCVYMISPESMPRKARNLMFQSTIAMEAMSCAQNTPGSTDPVTIAHDLIGLLAERAACGQHGKTSMVSCMAPPPCQSRPCMQRCTHPQSGERARQWECTGRPSSYRTAPRSGSGRRRWCCKQEEKHKQNEVSVLQGDSTRIPAPSATTGSMTLPKATPSSHVEAALALHVHEVGVGALQRCATRVCVSGSRSWQGPPCSLHGTWHQAHCAALHT